MGALLAWSLAAALLGAAWTRGSSAGAHGEAPARWPTDATIALATDRPTVVLFAHPRCPCTSGRGHEGDNAGRDVLLAALSAQPTLAEADVYGCAL